MKTKMLRKTIAAIMAMTVLSSGSVITANAETFDEWVANHSDHTWIETLGPTYEAKYYYASHPQPGANSVYVIGSQCEEVKWIKCAMNWIFRANNQPLTIDRTYDSKTAYWVKAYQKAVGITVDGKFGPQTRAKVLDYLRRTPYKGK